MVIVSAEVGRWRLSQLYEELQYLAPAVVFLEDLDLLVGGREDRSAQAGLMEFLTVLDGLMTRHHEVVTVATSNDLSAIDAAASRAGRFDIVLEIGPPDERARREIVGHYLEKLNCADAIDLDRIAGCTEGATGADLREIIRRSFLATLGTGITHESLVATAESLFFARSSDGGGTPEPDSPSRSGSYL